MPLFDRLIDRDRFLKRELVQTRTLDRRGVKESVRRELEQLFNTRCHVPAHRLALRELTVIEYGIPDFSTFAARNPYDRMRLEGILRRTIEAFEPRLTNVRVEIDPKVADDFHLNGVIYADLVFDGVPEPVLFTTVLKTKEGSVDVHAE